MTNIQRLDLLLFVALLFWHVESAIEEKRKGQGRVKSQIDITPKIIGGYDTTPGRYPYYTGLWYQPRKVFPCGGSLIAPDVVLTAAHCWVGPNRSYVAHVGRYNRDDPKDDYESFEIVTYKPFPFYGVEATFSGDFMLLFLNSTSSTPPLKINRDENIPHPGQNITVVGLGVDGGDDFFFRSFPSILQGAAVSAIANEECARVVKYIYGEAVTNKGLITADSLCVWRLGVHYCSGDSGGPLLIQGRSPEDDVQVGIVSWSRGCHSTAFPDVSARVSEAAEWIDAQVCRYSKAPPADFRCQNRTFPPDPLIPTNPVLTGNTYPATVVINLDRYPDETWWFIQNSTGHLIYIVPRYTYGKILTNSKVEQVVHLPIGQTYYFVIKDEAGDGIDSFGGYEIRLGTESDGEVLVDGYFSSDDEERTNFTLSSTLTSQPTASPTWSKAPTISPAPTLPVRAVTLTINFGTSQSYYFGYTFLNSVGEEINKAKIGSFGYYNTTVEAVISLPKDENYTFVFLSSGEILYPGNYSLALGTPNARSTVLIESNGTFSRASDDDTTFSGWRWYSYGDPNTTETYYNETFTFYLPNSFTAVPSLAPSGSPSTTPTVTPRPTRPLQMLTLTINFDYHDPTNYAYVLLDGRNRTVINETAGVFDEYSPTAQKVMSVESDERYTFILLNIQAYSLYPGNFTITLGRPDERGPVLAPNNDVDDYFIHSNDDGVYLPIVDKAQFFVPSKFTSVPSMAPTFSAPVTLFIDFAGFPSEVGFSFLDDFQDPIVSKPFGTFGFENKTFQDVFDLPAGFQYTFVISDYFGDNRFPGRFSLTFGTPESRGKTIVSKTGIKGFKEEYPFSLTFSPEAAPSPAMPHVGVSAVPSPGQTPVSSGAQFTTSNPSFVVPVSGTPVLSTKVPSTPTKKVPSLHKKPSAKAARKHPRTKVPSETVGGKHGRPGKMQ